MFPPSGKDENGNVLKSTEWISQFIEPINGTDLPIELCNHFILNLNSSQSIVIGG